MSAVATTKPPFDIPIGIKRRGPYWAQRTIPKQSDGDERTWPTPESGYKPYSPNFYRCHLGQRWAEVDGIAEAGVNYYLDSLPAGYAMFEIKQPSGPQVYKRLFGHPCGSFYDSALRFEVHFLWLMSGMENDCECVLCVGKAQFVHIQQRAKRPRQNVVLPAMPKVRRDHVDEDDESNSDRSGSLGNGGLASNRMQRRRKQAGAPYAQDEEGTEDVYKDCVRQLERSQGDKNGIEIDLKEDNSIDWKAEDKCLPQYLTQIEQQHTFVPRIGELVLWCADWPDEEYLLVDPATRRYKFYSFKSQKFHGTPAWRGGVVASVPSAVVKNGPLDFSDILEFPQKNTSLNTAGFRIETLPDPNNDEDKSLSKQFKYVPLRNIRPLAQWKLLLRGISKRKLHQSVYYALTCMTSISLVGKWRFRGEWPVGHIFCKAIFLGSELITIGDTVRLLAPPDGHHDDTKTCTDVMTVTSIRYNLADILPEHALNTNPGLSRLAFVSLVGQAFTTDVQRAHGAPFRDEDATNASIRPMSLSLESIKGIFRPVGTAEYGTWYPLHGPKHRFEVSHEHILGKLYEADAVRLWTGQRQTSNDRISKPDLSFDADSVMIGRRYASATDERLPEPTDGESLPIQWYVADTRADALAISTMNGLDVGSYHDIRDAKTLKYWRGQVRIADGKDVSEVTQSSNPYVSWQDAGLGGDTGAAAGKGPSRGRPAGSRVINGKLYRKGEALPEELSSEKRVEIKSSSQMAGAGMASDDEEDDEDAEGILEEFLPIPHPRRPIQQPSKLDIMLAAGAEAEAGHMMNDDDWFDEPLPYARGGTEESEGGDYRE